jgi:hypothetical protein
MMANHYHWIANPDFFAPCGGFCSTFPGSVGWKRLLDGVHQRGEALNPNFKPVA